MKDGPNYTLITPDTGRQLSDDAWDTIEPNHINLWESAVQLLGDRRIELGETAYKVHIDWRPTLTRLKRSYAATKYCFAEMARRPSDANDVLMNAKFPKRPAKNTITITFEGAAPHRVRGIVETVIHDFFLIMNLAGPGSCNFSGARLIGDDYEDEISLSNFNFELALQTYLAHGWPLLRVLNLKTVMSWYLSVRNSPTQTPQNPMERVLFAFLHMAKAELSPMTVVWLFYAFESLLQTKVGENFSSIVTRLCLLLELDDAQSKIIKKRMRALYEIRSAVVHGGFEVIHPMHDESLDERVDDTYGKLMEATDWGQAFLVASVQKTIERGCRFPRFSEIMLSD